MKKTARFYLALWCAKFVQGGLKLVGRKGGCLPGDIALQLCPDFMGRIDKPQTVICVTGTNGKTTTCNMIISALEKNGYDVLDNRAGTNINSGIASSLIQGSTMGGKAKKKIAVFEVDERSSKLVYSYVEPTYFVCTNLFRDSIHRNANPEFIFNFINNALPASSHLVLNADDLISGQLGHGNEKTYFSIDPLPSDHNTDINLINDARICPKCHKRLSFDFLRYHHIGHAHCESCGFTSPTGDYRAALDIDGATMSVATPDGTESYPLVSNSVFNAYNQLTAIALLRTFGLAYDQVKDAFEAVEIVESRYSARKAGNVDVVTNMSKGQNPIACSIVFDYVKGEPGKKEVILDLDDVFDRKDSSEIMTWIYDCDFEFLAQDDITNIVICGTRTKDYKLRLLMAGVPEEKIQETKDAKEAPSLLKLDGTNKVFILHELYADTEALELRDMVCARIEKAGK